LLAIIDKLGYETGIFIGHSFGGFVTQEFTFRYPERVTALGVIGCTDIAIKPALVMRVAYKIMPYMLPRLSLEDFRKRTVENVSAREDITQYAYQATGKLSKEEYIDVIMAGLECLAIDSGYPAHYSIAKPFLLTHGALDKANGSIFPKSAPTWAKKEPNAVYKVIPDAGHTANQDNPDAFNVILLDFLTTHSGT
jgi:pimeloyl-ACP methyl ester carboxylesterase